MFILLGDHSGCTNAMKKTGSSRDQFDSNAKNGRKNDSQFLSYRKHEEKR